MVMVVVARQSLATTAFFFAVRRYVEERAGEAAAGCAGGAEFHAGRHHRGEARERGVGVGDEFEQGRREHVARRAGFELEEQRAHG